MGAGRRYCTTSIDNSAKEILKKPGCGRRIHLFNLSGTQAARIRRNASLKPYREGFSMQHTKLFRVSSALIREMAACADDAFRSLLKKISRECCIPKTKVSRQPVEIRAKSRKRSPTECRNFSNIRSARIGAHANANPCLIAGTRTP